MLEADVLQGFSLGEIQTGPASDADELGFVSPGLVGSAAL